MLMDKLPTELFIEFLFSIDDLNALKNFCKINKGARELCRRYRVAICKKFLQRYQVDYNDPTNFIYVMNNVKKESFFKDGEPEYCRLLFLYSKFYDHKSIHFGHGRFGKEITSMPLYPNVKSLVCYGNNLKSLPDGMRNLTFLDCNSNKLTSLPNGMINENRNCCRAYLEHDGSTLCCDINDFPVVGCFFIWQVGQLVPHE
jgi:Leucine-rich repeat (LRR) protein